MMAAREMLLLTRRDHDCAITGDALLLLPPKRAALVTVPFGERSRGDTRGCQRASRAPVRRKRERRQSSEKVRGVNHITLSSRIGAVLLVDFEVAFHPEVIRSAPPSRVFAATP